MSYYNFYRNCNFSFKWCYQLLESWKRKIISLQTLKFPHKWREIWRFQCLTRRLQCLTLMPARTIRYRNITLYYLTIYKSKTINIIKNKTADQFFLRFYKYSLVETVSHGQTCRLNITQLHKTHIDLQNWISKNKTQKSYSSTFSMNFYTK